MSKVWDYSAKFVRLHTGTLLSKSWIRDPLEIELRFKTPSDNSLSPGMMILWCRMEYDLHNQKAIKQPVSISHRLYRFLKLTVHSEELGVAVGGE